VDAGASAPPGVHFRFTNAKCSYSLKEAAAGIDFGYEIVVDADITLTHTTCKGASNAGGLALEEDVADGKGLHSYCAGGLCPSETTSFVLKAGTYPRTYHWDGYSYAAPADACTRETAYPAGSYTLDISEQYTLGDAGTPSAIHGTLRLTLTP
jgi:hypothetical protein